MRTPLVLAALVTIAIGGTGRAAPLPPLADGAHVALYAYAVDRGGMATPLGTCAEVADRAACDGLEARVADARRTVALADMSKGWSGARRGAFARLVVAEDLFARAVAANEVEAPGDRAAAERAETDAFLRHLQTLLRGETGTPDTSSFAALDGALNDAYSRVMATPASGAWGGVGKAGIRRTERAWLAYRDAFAAFAATLPRRGAAMSVQAELTRRRTASLEAFLED